ncbi:MAG: nucleotidyltransferase domain-containing protein [Bacteroidales bacterium]|nr:nucleotidyltransferase domain-containing protein [Bacteroidales bacterium]
MDRNELVKRIKQEIVKIDNTATVILYGSQARGDYSADSDIDILILIDGNELSVKREDKYMSVLYDLELESMIPISPRVVLKKNWYNRPFTTPYYINVTNEGIVL